MIMGMSDLERRTGSRPSRRQREQRAYNLVVAGGTLGLVFVVGTLLAILAVVCAILFRRTVS